MEIEKMTDYRLIERFFYEARRNAFLVSFFYFIAGVAGLGALTMFPPELGIAIPILGGVWIVTLTLIFLSLIWVLYRPIAEITKMVDRLFDELTKEEQ